MVKETRWRPDTCACELVYSWDSTSTEADRVHTFSSVKPCKEHETSSGEPLYLAVVAENQLKNRATNIVTQEVRDATVRWQYDAARKLTLLLNGVTPTERTRIETKLVETLGVDAVRVDVVT